MTGRELTRALMLERYGDPRTLSLEANAWDPRPYHVPISGQFALQRRLDSPAWRRLKNLHDELAEDPRWQREQDWGAA